MTKLSVLYKKILITTLVLGAILTPNLAYSKGVDKATADAYKQENAAEQQELDYIEESTYDSNTAKSPVFRVSCIQRPGSFSM